MIFFYLINAVSVFFDNLHKYGNQDTKKDLKMGSLQFLSVSGISNLSMIL